MAAQEERQDSPAADCPAAGTGKGILVIGGGVTGIQAALDLTRAGAQVYLVEKTPSVGGRMAQLDKTLPTNDCSICILSPLLVEALRNPNIRLLSYSEVIGLEGTPGSYHAKVLRKARYVSEDTCVGCGVCPKPCPVSVPNEFEMGLGDRKAIYVPFQQAAPLVYTVDTENCLNFKNGKFEQVCDKCVSKCPRGAISFDLKEEIVEIDVAAVLVATGFDEMNPRPLRNLSYGDIPDVLTGMEFERMLNASGPTTGHVVKRSDGEIPESIAFVQCVGSRDERYNSFCSRVCCVYSVKQCIVAKDHEPKVKDFHYFYRDMRAYGRGFEEFYLRGKNETGINYIRSSPSSIQKNGNGRIAVHYEDPETARPASIDVDMVILSCAMIPSAGTDDLAKTLGIEVGADGYFKIADPLSDPLTSTREGVLICGCASGPKDIPDSVAQASAGCAKALAYLGDNKVVAEEKPLPEHDPDEEPRIGVFICHCGLNIAGVVDSKGVAKYAKTLPGVAYATDNLYTCSDDTQKKIYDWIKKHKLNRVVVAACTPRTHEPIFRQTCAEAGVNPYLFDMANIRDQCSWVHADVPEDATEKAKDLVRMAVSRAQLLRPLPRKTVEVDKSALVIGGGISGIQCAIDTARQGIKTYLVEKDAALGGQLNNLDRLFPSNQSASELLEAKLEDLKKAGVEVMTSAEVESVEGFVGNFEVKVGGRDLKIGALVLATGGEILDPEGKLGYGKFKNVITSNDFEKVLKETETFDGDKQIVFVQCVGSRQTEGYTGCSRYCCHVSLKQADAAIKKGAKAAIIHRDVRAFTRDGEALYRDARRDGVHFLRRPDDREVEVQGNGTAESVLVFDQTLLSDVKLDCDLVVLAVPLVASPTAAPLAEMLRIPMGLDGFYLDIHVKLGPLETNTEGIFLCGCSQYPKDIPDSLAQASGVAAKVGALLSKGFVNLDPTTATVRTELCRACGTCVEICEYNAPNMVEKDGKTYVEINEALCKGCGTCASHCPTGAIVARHFTDGQVEAMIDILFAEQT